MVDEANKVNFYDGKISVVDPDGKRIGKYAPAEYTDWIAEHVEPWTYLKFPYLKKIGWKGFVDGATPASTWRRRSRGSTHPMAWRRRWRRLSTRSSTARWASRCTIAWRSTGRG